MQKELFSEFEKKPINKSLVITKGSKKTLTKNQVEFNKLTVKIEKLQKDIEKKKLQFDQALNIYAKDILPAETTLKNCRKELIILLWEVYKNKSLSKTDLKFLKEIVSHNLELLIEELGNEEDLDEAIGKIFEAIEGYKYGEMTDEDDAELDEILRNKFKEDGIDLGDVDMNDPDAMAAKFAEIRAENEKKENEKQKKRNAKKKKSAKEIAFEKLEAETEELKGKNISTIYKQLAKLFHPDLEQDETRKAEKAILMQELIAAYEAKDLHTLLSLELKWIHKQNDHLQSLADEKLAIYVQILKEQVDKLDYEKNTIYYKSQYNVLVEKFGFAITRNPIQTSMDCLVELNEMRNEIQNDLKKFKSDNALKHIKAIIKDWKKYGNDEDEEDIFEILFGKL